MKGWTHVVAGAVLPWMLAAHAATATPTESAYEPLTLSPADARADVALARRALERIHPGLTRYTDRATLDAAFARLEQSAAGGTTDLTLWRELALLAAAIHCDHTKPEPPERLTAFRESHPTHLPFRFVLVEGRMIVVSADPQPGAPPPGSEILALNRQPIARVLAELAPAVAYDGLTDQAIAAKLSEDADLMGGDLDEYWPAFHGMPTAWEVDWKRMEDTTSTRAALRPIGFDTWKALPWRGSRYRNEFYNAITWRLAGKAAVLRIDTFVNYRNPVDATAFLGGFFRAMKAAGTQRLILDLRNNSGGSEDVSVALGRYLMPAPFVWSKPVLLKAIRYDDLPRYIESWGDRDALFEPPLGDFRKTTDGWWERIPKPGRDDDESTLEQALADDRFDGELILLAGPRNGSGATRTIAQFKDKRAARILGEATAGSAEGPTAGHVFLLTLPHSGVKLRIPNAWNRTNIARFDSGRGVAADEVVIDTLADTLAGVDQVLAVAKATTPKAAPELAATLAGRWSGTVDTRDPHSDERFAAAARVSASADGDGIDVSAEHDGDPGIGPGCSPRQRWTLAVDHRSLEVDGERFRVVEYLGGPGDGDLTLVAEGTGTEGGIPVAIRVNLVRRGDRLDLARLVHRPSQPFLLRSGFRLKRRADRP